MRNMNPYRHYRDQSGFSMFIVIMGMFVMSMFVAAGFAAANGDLPLSGDSKDRKIEYAAAESGLNFYLTHLSQDPDYWTKCENVPAPNTTGDVSPVSRVWNGVGADTRTWRNVTGSQAQYTLELLPANGNAFCVPGNDASVLDTSTGTLRIRATGRPSLNDPQRRSIIASFRRRSFLDYLYYTKFEDNDPQSLSTQSARTWANNNCAGLERWQRPATGCPEIQWVSGDGVAGPMHSEDSLLICNNPIFGRNSGDKIELVPKINDTVAAGGCSNSAVFKGVHISGAASLQPPDTNSELQKVAQAGGALYFGKTIIRLNGTTMAVTNQGVTTTSAALPANGVIYVASDPDTSHGTCQPTQYPAATNYDEDAACGNVYVSGTYAQSLTIGADNDIIIAPTTSSGTINWSSADENITYTNDAVLGLIANNFVRVGHKVKRVFDSRGNQTDCDNASTAMDGNDLTVQAAILSLAHSWIVDNYDCGKPLGNLNVFGAIAQLYRGPVGTTAPTGFLKQYVYDDRFHYRSPPHFLSPVDSAWTIIRFNEQVPATGTQ
jgi:hypothetical protein